MDPQRRLFLRGRTIAKTPPFTPRPPWAIHEAAFVSHCTRCDACIQACPESILGRGDGDFPEVSFKDTGCTLCGQCAQACETGALDFQAHRSPWSWRVAVGDNCLAKLKVECRVCAEICDVNAIRFKPTLGGVAAPALDLSLCTGCGACIAPCPTQAIAMKNPEP